jgi:hypothetical protein
MAAISIGIAAPLPACCRSSAARLLGGALAVVGLHPAVCLSSARGYPRTPGRTCLLAPPRGLASCQPCPAATSRRCPPSRLWPWPVTCWTATSARTRCWPSSRRCGSRLGSAATGSRSRRPTTTCSPWPFSWSSSGGRSDSDPCPHRLAHADLDGRPPRRLEVRRRSRAMGSFGAGSPCARARSARRPIRRGARPSPRQRQAWVLRREPAVTDRGTCGIHGRRGRS